MEHDYRGTTTNRPVPRTRPFAVADSSERRLERLGCALDDVVDAFIRLSAAGANGTGHDQLRFAAAARRLWRLAHATEPAPDK